MESEFSCTQVLWRIKNLTIRGHLPSNICADFMPHDWVNNRSTLHTPLKEFNRASCLIESKDGRKEKKAKKQEVSKNIDLAQNQN